MTKAQDIEEAVRLALPHLQKLNSEINRRLEESLRMASDILARLEKSQPKTIYQGVYESEPFYPPERIMLAEKVQNWHDDVSELRRQVESAKGEIQSNGLETTTAYWLVHDVFFCAYKMYSKYFDKERR